MDCSIGDLTLLTEEERPPELETKATVATPYSSEGEDIQEHSCQRVADLTKELLSETVSDDALRMKETCTAEIRQHCVQRSKNPPLPSTNSFVSDHL